MAYEEILKLFDFYWFENEILRNKTTPSSSNPVLDTHDEEGEEPEQPLLKLSQTPSFIVRSFSEQSLSSKGIATLVSYDSSPSPKSVLPVPKLETIFSGKEAGVFSSESAAKNVSEKNGASGSDRGGRFRRRRKGRDFSRSLSELEFEELKGFMDLGFVFSDEDKDSSLVSIIPGLQRFGKKVGGGEENDDDGDDKEIKASVDESTVSRPYLSEAWDVLDDEQMKTQKLSKDRQLMMNYRIAAMGSTDLEIKDQLKFWAHSVTLTSHLGQFKNLLPELLSVQLVPSFVVIPQ